MSGRVIRAVLLAAFVAGVGSYLNQLQSGLGQYRDDLLGRTRFLIRQAHRGDAEMRGRLTARYRVPAADPAHLSVDLDRLWILLHSAEPTTVAYADAASATAGTSGPQTQVIFKGRDERGRSITVRLGWVQIEGRWYIEGYRLV